MYNYSSHIASNLCFAVKWEAESRGLHGVCQISVLPAPTIYKGDHHPKELWKNSTIFPSAYILIGGQFEDHFPEEDDFYENYASISGEKTGKMLSTNQPNHVNPAGRKLMLGENEFQGGDLHNFREVLVIFSLSTNEPDQNNEIIDLVIEKHVIQLG